MRKFDHLYGDGIISFGLDGKVLSVLANIPLGRLEAGYDERKIRRLEEDAKRFASENDIDQSRVQFAQGAVDPRV
jgi:hypothetical protein